MTYGNVVGQCRNTLIAALMIFIKCTPVIPYLILTGVEMENGKGEHFYKEENEEIPPNTFCDGYRNDVVFTLIELPTKLPANAFDATD